jgi:hypothetical protein
LHEKFGSRDTQHSLPARYAGDGFAKWRTKAFKMAGSHENHVHPQGLVEDILGKVVGNKTLPAADLHGDRFFGVAVPQTKRR